LLVPTCGNLTVLDDHLEIRFSKKRIRSSLEKEMGLESCGRKKPL